MFVNTLKDLSKHPAVAEVVRKRGDITVALKSEWMNVNGTRYVLGKKASDVIAAFNGCEVFRVVDFDRAPKSITFTSRNLWRDESGNHFFVMKMRCELTGIMDGAGPQYRAVEILEEKGRPAWDKKDYVNTPVMVAWRALEENPAEYGLADPMKAGGEYSVFLGGRPVNAESIAAAVVAFEKYRDENGLGADDMKASDGHVSLRGVRVARISYNGRVWNVDGTEVK